MLYTDPTGKCVPEWVPLIGEEGCTIAEGAGKGHYDVVGAGKVVVAGGGVAATVVGCAATALLGCAAVGAGAAAVTSWGTQALDNAGKPVVQAAVTDVSWGTVARDATIGAASSFIGGTVGKGVGFVCRTGPWCATAVGAAIGSAGSGTYRILGNLTDGNPNTAAMDGVLGACVFGGLIGAITGRVTYGVNSWLQQRALNDAIRSARAAYARLGSAPPGKTIAAVESGQSTTSGWKGDQTTVARVMAMARRIGYTLQSAGAFDQGVPGQYNASHAEKKLSILAPNEPIAVSRPMCTDCQNYFQALARAIGRFQVVADPDYVRIFPPDGSIDVIPR